MEQVAHEAGYMLTALFVAAVSATVTGMLGFLPGRSFRFRLLLIAAILVVGVIGAWLAKMGATLAFHSVVARPDGYITREEAIMEVYVGLTWEVVILALLVPVAYLVRCRLTRLS